MRRAQTKGNSQKCKGEALLHGLTTTLGHLASVASVSPEVGASGERQPDPQSLLSWAITIVFSRPRTPDHILVHSTEPVYRLTESKDLLEIVRGLGSTPNSSHDKERHPYRGTSGDTSMEGSCRRDATHRAAYMSHKPARERSWSRAKVWGSWIKCRFRSYNRLGI